jgi:hypothetical protein
LSSMQPQTRCDRSIARRRDGRYGAVWLQNGPRTAGRSSFASGCATGKCVALEEAGEELFDKDLDVTGAKVVRELLA